MHLNSQIPYNPEECQEPVYECILYKDGHVRCYAVLRGGKLYWCGTHIPTYLDDARVGSEVPRQWARTEGAFVTANSAAIKLGAYKLK